jgi:glycosyltransferase involved in cell wall biosynthesis
MSKKVLWLHADRMAVGTYRCFVPSLSLMDSGRHQTYFVEHGQSFDRFGPLFGNLQDVDVLVIQRAVAETFIKWAKEARRRGIKVVYETDDDVFHVARHNPAYAQWGTASARKTCEKLITMADHVVVSTQPLKDSIREHCGLPDARVTVAYNHVHPIIWGQSVLEQATPADNKGRLVIGWQGSATHRVDFTAAIDGLARVVNDYPQTIVRFFGDVPLCVKGKIPGKRFEWMKGVTFDQYPRNLRYANFDIALAPLVDSRFNRAKSNIKVLEAWATRVPIVASPVYPYRTTITHGENGYLADSPDDWYNALSDLILNPGRRRAMAARGYDDVWANWSHTTRAKAWVDLFDRLTGATDATDTVPVLSGSRKSA